MNRELENEIKRISNLKNFKHLPPEEIEKKALLQLRLREFEKNHEFLNKNEEKVAKSLFLNYLENYEFDNISDLSTLGDLIVNEIQLKRIETAITDYYKNLAEKNKDKKDKYIYIPDKLLKSKQDLENHILDLKLRLGIDKDKEDKEDELTALQTLQIRFNKYIQAHKHEFTTVCPSCGKILLFRKRVKDFDSLPHSWFVGRWFFNYEILKDVKENKLSKEDAWRYMVCASQGGNYKPAFSKKYCTDYIDYCLKNWNEITKHFKVLKDKK